MLYKMQCNLVALDQSRASRGRSQMRAGVRADSRIKSRRLKQTTAYTIFFPNTIRNWNSLPLIVVEAQSLNSSRAQLEMFWFNSIVILFLLTVITISEAADFLLRIIVWMESKYLKNTAWTRDLILLPWLALFCFSGFHLGFRFFLKKEKKKKMSWCNS